MQAVFGPQAGPRRAPTFPTARPLAAGSAAAQHQVHGEATAGVWHRAEHLGVAGPGVLEHVGQQRCLAEVAGLDVDKPVHDRMPVILPPEAYAAWLDPQVKSAEV